MDSLLGQLPGVVIGALAAMINFAFRSFFDARIANRKVVEDSQRAAFSAMLNVAARRQAGEHTQEGKINQWHKDLAVANSDILFWCPDDVLVEYIKYSEHYRGKSEFQEHEKHFAKAVLAFRKKLGYSNDTITEEQIVWVMKSGNPGKL